MGFISTANIFRYIASCSMAPNASLEIEKTIVYELLHYSCKLCREFFFAELH